MLSQMWQLLRASGAIKFIAAILTMFIMLLPLRFNNEEDKK